MICMVVVTENTNIFEKKKIISTYLREEVNSPLTLLRQIQYLRRMGYFLDVHLIFLGWLFQNEFSPTHQYL